MKILIIEDNVAIARNIWRFFEIEWIKSEISNNWKEWFKKALMNFFDLIILDINLPEMSGIEICENLRKRENNIPILMLTSNSQDKDIIKWLNIWADDYLTKPFDLDVLLARIKALTRRNLKNKSSKIEIIFEENWEQKIEINLEKKEVLKNWEIIKLSSLEFNLLEFFAQNKWKVLNRKNIFEKVWGDFDEFMFSRNVDIYIWYLRKKLWKKIIETKKGIGYLVQ